MVDRCTHGDVHLRRWRGVFGVFTVREVSTAFRASTSGLHVAMSQALSTVAVMELVPDFVEPPPVTRNPRHPIRWTLLAIASILILENWRFVAVTLALMSFVVLLVSFIVIIAFLRKMTRPIGQLSLFDVAFVAWVYRLRERMKSRHRQNGDIVVRK
jgi:sensor histidine kinase YesM